MFLYYSIQKILRQLCRYIQKYAFYCGISLLIVISLFSLVLSRYYFKVNYSLLHETQGKTEFLQQEKEDLLLEKTKLLQSKQAIKIK